MGWNSAWPNADEDRVNRDFRVKTRFGTVYYPQGVDRTLAPLLAALILETTERYRYRLIPGHCWGFYNRNIADTNIPSTHSMGGGKAVDNNAPANSRGTRGDIPMEVVLLWERWGFSWGGRWSYTDPMHFEYRGTRLSAWRRGRRANRLLRKGKRL